MSVLDQLSNIGNDVTSSAGNALGIGAPTSFTDGQTFLNDGTPFFQPLDVKASILFNNLSVTLNIKGESLSVDPIKNQTYPMGFTPEVDFITDPKNIDPKTNSPVERGVLLGGGILNSDGTTLYGELRDTNDILDTSILIDDSISGSIPKAFDAFNDLSGEEFLHRLNTEQIPIGAALGKYNDIYLSSFVQTNKDNEDPISFGYDIIIGYDNSPLFNGAIEDFIINFSSYTEISSRLDVLAQFKTQFFKFFKIDSPTSTNSIDDSIKIRTYYLKKLVGLDNLSESILPGKSKQFINYGADDEILTLTLNEDVAANMGYLAALYKTLTWSKVHGKKMIPDNLLRFDMEIVVTEARKYNRATKNDDDTLNQYADFLSRYRYTVYECQFFFDKMSHGDSIDMWGLDTSQGFDIKINYKFSTVKFEKFTDFDFKNNVITINYGSTASIDNSKIDLGKIDSKDSDGFFIVDNTIVLSPIKYYLKNYSGYAPNSSAANATDEFRGLVGVNTTTDNFAQKLADKQAVQQSNTLSLRDQLLQATLENIDGEFGFNLSNLGSMVIGKLNGGFTEDGYEYNIAAHYTNKAINIASDLVGKVVNPIINNIYAEKILFQESVLMNINNGIGFLNNQLNGAGQKQNLYVTSADDLTPPPRSANQVTNIYGNGTPSPLVYSGDSVGNDNPPDTPPHNPGAPFDIYNNTKEEVDTPAHHTGTTFDIYDIKQNEPDTPPHHTGTTFDIYNNTKEEVDTPPHHTGATFDIYSNTKEEPDTPPHNSGSTFNIYNNTKEEVDTPPHNIGSTFDIYNNTKEEPDTPPHHTGVGLNIYDNQKEYPDFPIEGPEGPTFNIYNNKKEYPYTPAHTTGKLMSIYGKK